MKKFIYVFSLEEKDKLVAQEFKLVKSDEENNIYVFENKAGGEIALESFRFVTSDTLTF